MPAMVSAKRICCVAMVGREAVVAAAEIASRSGLADRKAASLVCRQRHGTAVSSGSGYKFAVRKGIWFVCQSLSSSQAVLLCLVQWQNWLSRKRSSEKRKRQQPSGTKLSASSSLVRRQWVPAYDVSVANHSARPGSNLRRRRLPLSPGRWPRFRRHSN